MNMMNIILNIHLFINLFDGAISQDRAGPTSYKGPVTMDFSLELGC